MWKRISPRLLFGIAIFVIVVLGIIAFQNVNFWVFSGDQWGFGNEPFYNPWSILKSSVVYYAIALIVFVINWLIAGRWKSSLQKTMGIVSAVGVALILSLAVYAVITMIAG